MKMPPRDETLSLNKAPHLSSARPPEKSTGCREAPVTHEVIKDKLDRRTRDKEEMESQREQVIWRLERLLGETCSEGRMAAETHPPSDSICTEDFVRCFRDEMVELPLPESNLLQLDRAAVAQRTERSDCDTYRCDQKGQSVLSVDGRGTAATFEREQLSDGCGVNISHASERAGGETQQRREEDGNSEYFLP